MSKIFFLSGSAFPGFPKCALHKTSWKLYVSSLFCFWTLSVCLDTSIWLSCIAMYWLRSSLKTVCFSQEMQIVRKELHVQTKSLSLNYIWRCPLTSTVFFSGDTIFEKNIYTHASFLSKNSIQWRVDRMHLKKQCSLKDTIFMFEKLFFEIAVLLWTFHVECSVIFSRLEYVVPLTV